MKKVALFVLVLFLATFAWAQSVTIQIEGSAVPYYVPIFTGIEMGFFAEEGLEVEYFFGSASDIVRNVAVGNVEFGFPNGEPVITARSQGIPVNVIHTTYQHGLGATLFLKESGIKTPADLKGKKVAITSYGSPNYVQLQVLLKKNGMTLDDIDLEIIGTEAIVPALVNKRVDAICFSMLRTFELKYQGIEVEEFRSDAFLPSFGNVVVTGDKLLKENRELAVKFTRALSRVMAYLSDPENMKQATYMTIEKYTPTYAGREEYMAAVLSEVYAGYLWKSDDTAAFGFGFGNVGRWQNTIDLMKEYEIITTDVQAEDFVIPRL
ncbi:MAG TPA: ABC transporter substrate-binding protein [Thermotogota bacterium]|nr:ABC transporter substrate-binding protein [Thermotogota bacterium]HRW92884.1 ABC transporter substrate-binding protein [Thermotogota bacterium]